MSPTILLTTTIVLLFSAIGIIIYIRKLKRSVADTERLRAIIHSIPQAILLINNEGVITHIGNLNTKIFDGYTQDDIIGRNILELYSRLDGKSEPTEQSWERMKRRINSIIESGIPIRSEIYVKEKYLFTITSRFSDTCVYTQIFDNTHIVNEKLKRDYHHKNEIAVAFSAGGMISWIYDIKSGIFTFSKYDDSENGEISFDELKQMALPQYRESISSKFHDLETGKSSNLELIFPYTNKLGSVVWIRIYAIPHDIGPNGEVLTIIGSQKDITKEIEVNKRIADSRIKLKMVVRSSGMQRWEYNTKTQIIRIFYGNIFPSGNIKLCEMERYVHPDDINYLYSELQNLTDGIKKNTKFDMRLTIDGETYRWLTFSAGLFDRENDGNTSQVIGLFQDITERVMMTNELIYLRDKAEESNRLKSAFLANMSHEIRTPLNAIVGFSNLLAYTDEEDEKQEYAQIIEQNNTLLLTLIDDILDLSRIESGRIEFAISPINVYTLLSNLRQTAQLKAKPGVEVILDEIEDKNLEITSDTQRLSQVLINFLNNASKFTNQGTIRIGCEDHNDKVRFYVKDTGIGVSKENLDKVFNRFFKLNSNIPGTGLGLSICEMIVHMLGGSIGANSQEGVGSEFWFVLPKQAAPNTTEVISPIKLNENTVKRTPPLRKRKKNRQILICEDNPNNFILYEKILSDYELIHAWNGLETIELFITTSPNIVIMDIDMANLNGFEATTIMRRQDPHVAIIAVSLSTSPQSRTGAIANGFSEFVSKPIDVSKFKLLIDNYMTTTEN